MMTRAVVSRLEFYLSCLRDLKEQGRTTVTSDDLALYAGVSPSCVRQDFMRLGTEGRPRSGYDLVELQGRIRAALDLHHLKPIVLVGCGNLGRALAASDIWRSGGFDLVGLFDRDRALIGQQIGALEIRHTSELVSFIRTNNVDAACLTVPGPAAQQVVGQLVTAGVRAIWNFTPHPLQAPSHVIIENQRLESGLMTLSYLMTSPSRQEPDMRPAITMEEHKR